MQPKLFDERALLWGPEFQSGLFAQIVFNRPLRTSFSYSVPEDLVAAMAVGKRVLAPFGRGNHRTTGFCVGLSRDPPPAASAIKPILAIVDEQPLLSGQMLELTRWIADHYFCGWGQVLDAVLPRAVKLRSGTRWGVFLAPVPKDQWPQSAELTSKQRRAFEALCAIGRPALIKEIGQSAKCGPDCVKALIEKGLVTVSRQRVAQRREALAPIDRERPHVLQPDQSAALGPIVQAVAENRFQSFLLHGVTGSGKTEVYLQAITEAVRRGRQAIVLVPEISLTPQTIERFRKRFDHVAVLHSHLTDVDRHWHWRQIAEGAVDVVVGARSAIFAPFPNLGLIVLDEEHENTFKQDNTPRYHARDVALERGRLENVPVILGSATPSLESWHAAGQGRHRLLTLAARVTGAAMPRVQILDLRSDFSKSRGGAISVLLARAIDATVSAGGQVILLLNRRGFAPTILCPQCGRVEMCAHCDVALTLHKDLGRLICHFCDAEFSPPAQCADCKGMAIRYSGVGTERLEDEVRARFPNARCARMDSDTMHSTAHYEQVLSAFQKNEIQILLGTQMIAKGLDFPNVHLVGVVTADTGRHIPDFRASERTFQLVAQVAGRTGRGNTPGRVLVQTFSPDDPAILAASRHDYLRFVSQEMPLRAEYGYPPYHGLTRIIVRSKSLDHARATAEHLAERCRQAAEGHSGVRILGPAPAPIARHRDFHRMHLQLHTPVDFDRLAFLTAAFEGAEITGDAEHAVDVDPVSLL